jgi:hypothetical protein
MIVFGWNSFKLDQCQPSKLGLPPETDSQFIIERRQKYFHLFWIPFFGIGKFWALRKFQDNQLYDAPIALHSLLESLPLAHKTPWYTYSLVWLLLGGFLMFTVGSTISDYNSKLAQERYQIKRTASMEGAIANFAEGSHFKFQDPSSYKSFYFKPVRSEGQSIKGILAEPKEGGYSVASVLEAFAVDESQPTTFDTITIRKDDLMKTINRDGGYSFEGYEIVKGKGNLVFQELHVIQFPVLKRVAMEYAEGKFFALLQNIGAPGKIRDYKPSTTTNVQFDKPLVDQEIPQGGIFVIEGSYIGDEPRLYGSLTVQAKRDSTAQFDFNIRGLHVALTQHGL